MLKRVSAGSPGAGAGIAPPHRLAVWTLGSIAAVVVLLQVYLISESYRRELSGRERLTSTLARVVEDQTQRSLQGITLLLDATESEMGTAKLAINHQTARLRLRSVPEVRGIYLVGPEGRVRDSTLSGGDIGLDIGSHDYVQQMLAQSGNSLAIGKPILRRSLTAPENTAHAFFPVALRLPGNAGLIVAAVNIPFLELQYRPLIETNAAAVTLARFDGTVLVDAERTWSPGASLAQDDPIFTTYLPGIEWQTFSRRAMAGKTAQIVSFRITRGFPVVVAVAIDRDRIWADWVQATLPTLLATPIAIALVLLALVLLGYQLRVIARQERSLRDSRDAAEAANKAKSQFLAVMSHEIRTPMNAVLGMSGTLIEEPLTPEQHACATSIHEAGEALLVILNDILDYTRLEWGMLALEETPFGPRRLLEQCVAIVRERAAAKQLALEIEAAEGIPVVLGDPGRIRQVLLNVLTNAIKFTASGKVTLSLGHALLPDGRVALRCAVSDTGIGIAEDRLGTLFSEFVQADASINRRFGGSGLGLAICKRIIERMGGTIGISSRLGEGTTVAFSIALPKARDQSEDIPAADQTRELDEAIAGLGRPLRLLVVDDNATNHAVAANMLRDFDIAISKALDGTQAVALAAAEPFDVILMDMRMPEMDGIAATRAIRTGGGRNASTQIIAFTANAFPEDEAMCRSAGMDDLVAKPVRKQRLLAALARALIQGGARAPAAGAAAQAAALPAPAAATAAAEEAVIFDPRPYRALEREIGPEAMAETVAIFVAEIDARLARMPGLDPSADREAIRREAHSIKGDARSFGFVALSRLAADLETEAKTAAPARYGEAVAALAQAWAKARAHVPEPAARSAA